MSYLRFVKKTNGMDLVPTAEGVREAKELLENDDRSPDDRYYEMIEYQLGNGWMAIPPEAIGALTDGPILSEDFIISDDGSYVTNGRAPWAVYHQESYMLVDPVERWAEGKSVYFRRFEVTKPKSGPARRMPSKRKKNTPKRRLVRRR